MGEEEKKPKVEGGGYKGKNRRPISRNNSAPTKQKYSAPTSGLEHVVFDFGTTKNAADFTKHRAELAKHVAVTFKYGGPIAAKAIEEMDAPVYEAPEDIPSDAPFMRIHTWKSDFDDFKRNERTWEENNGKMFNLLLQHCSPELESKLESMDEWADAKENLASMVLLNMIRKVCHQHDDTKQSVMTAIKSDKDVYTFWQGSAVNNTQYLREFKARIEVVIAGGGDIGLHKGIVDSLIVASGTTDADSITGSKQEAFDVKARAKYLACLFLNGADNTRYHALKTQLNNQFLMQKDAYPSTYEEALKLLDNFKVESNSKY